MKIFCHVWLVSGVSINILKKDKIKWDDADLRLIWIMKDLDGLFVCRCVWFRLDICRWNQVNVSRTFSGLFHMQHTDPLGVTCGPDGSCFHAASQVRCQGEELWLQLTQKDFYFSEKRLFSGRVTDRKCVLSAVLLGQDSPGATDYKVLVCGSRAGSTMRQCSCRSSRLVSNTQASSSSSCSGLPETWHLDPLQSVWENTRTLKFSDLLQCELKPASHAGQFKDRLIWNLQYTVYTPSNMNYSEFTYTINRLTVNILYLTLSVSFTTL